MFKLFSLKNEHYHFPQDFRRISAIMTYCCVHTMYLTIANTHTHTPHTHTHILVLLVQDSAIFPARRENHASASRQASNSQPAGLLPGHRSHSAGRYQGAVAAAEAGTRVVRKAAGRSTERDPRYVPRQRCVYVRRVDGGGRKTISDGRGFPRISLPRD